MVSNPFRPTRYEHASKPLLWLSPRAKELEAEGSFYVSGSRGSGKTSLLRALHWQERQFNETLKAQLTQRQSPFLSIYFRLPDHISYALSALDWTVLTPNSPDPTAVGFSYFSGLLEGIAAQLIFEALDEHRHLGLLKFSADNALTNISSFLTKFPELKSFLDQPATTYSDIANALDRLHRHLNISATRGDARSALERLPKYEPGGLVSAAAAIAAAHFGQKENSAKPFQVKICVDDCEVLRSMQQRFLNALVRKANSPVSWIVSYIGRDYEATTGVYKDHNLSGADRKVIDLDLENESSFVRLCEAVSSLRAYYSLSDEERSSLNVSQIDRIFSSETVLGTVDVNELIGNALKNSLSADAEQFRQRATALGNAIAKANVSDSRRHKRLVEMFPNHSNPPYYQAYLLTYLLRQPNIQNSLLTMSKAELARLNAYLRRKQRAAFIAICSRYRVKNIPYAGRGVIFGLSDGCIRDYLEIMAEIFDDYSTERNKILRFLDRRTPLPVETQRAGVSQSADNKFIGIKENIERHPVELSKLVECLGTLTALLHRDVHTAERGVFFLDPTEIRDFRDHAASEVQATVMGVIGRGVSEGLLKTDASSANEEEGQPLHRSVRFRLHRRFAPKYGFSYRGPYEPAHISWERIAEICYAPDVVEATTWARDVFESLSNIDLAQGKLNL
jgi:hypothetical protein